jgi:hypothetical protein
MSHLDYYVTRQTAERCAFNSLKTYKRQYGRPVSHHFKMGFITAYEDIALNKRPSPPIVPPSKYWNAYYRSPAGQPCVDDWFAGYDAGLEMGRNGSVAQFHEVYMRRGGPGGPVANANCDQPEYDDCEPQPSTWSAINPVNYMNGSGNSDF